MAHSWPGNVRELENRLTRALAMAEGTRIHASDLDLHGECVGNGASFPAWQQDPLSGWGNPAVQESGDVSATRSVKEEGPEAAATPSRGKMAAAALDINERQRKALQILLERGHLTRAEYQEALGGGIAPRTALSDLQDLVTKGLVKKTGRGPATRYKLLQRGRLVACVDRTPGGTP